MKNITKLLLASMVISFTSCSIKAQEKKLSNGNLKVGHVDYSIRMKSSSSQIYISHEDVSTKIWNLSRANPEKDVIPKSELKLNVQDLLKVKKQILGNNIGITVIFYFNTDENLMGIAYNLRKTSNITVEQFEKFDQAMHNTVKGALIKSFDYSNYLPYVAYPVVLR